MSYSQKLIILGYDNLKISSRILIIYNTYKYELELLLDLFLFIEFLLLWLPYFIFCYKYFLITIFSGE